MKTLERLLVRRMRLQVAEDLNPLKFTYQKHIVVEDAILYMLHRVYAYLDVSGSYVRIMFFYFSSAFKTIWPPIRKDKLLGMGVARFLTSWIIDYLTARPQYVRMGRCVSGTLECSIGALQGTVLAPFLKSPATYRSILMIRLLWHVCAADRRLHLKLHASQSALMEGK